MVIKTAPSDAMFFVCHVPRRTPESWRPTESAWSDPSRLLSSNLRPARSLGLRYPLPRGGGKSPPFPCLILSRVPSGIASHLLKRAYGFLQAVNLFLCPASLRSQ